MIYFAKKNKKLQPNDMVEYAIYSLPPIETCPSATLSCMKSCYAKKAYRMYKDYKRCLDNNLLESKKDTFVSEFIQYIENRLISCTKKNKTLYVRIHESGDFYNMTYYLKILEICEHFKNNKNVVFTCYTKSINLVYDHYTCQGVTPSSKGLKVYYSVWHDTSKFDIALAYCLDLPSYSVLDSVTYDKIPSQNKCECINCTTCDKCYNKNHNINLYVKIH